MIFYGMIHNFHGKKREWNFLKEGQLAVMPPPQEEFNCKWLLWKDGGIYTRTIIVIHTLRVQFQDTQLQDTGFSWNFFENMKWQTILHIFSFKKKIMLKKSIIFVKFKKKNVVCAHEFSWFAKKVICTTYDILGILAVISGIYYYRPCQSF